MSPDANKPTLRERVINFADSPHASWWLAVVAFFESWIFPIPPDVLIIALLSSGSTWRRATWYALVTTLASVAGGIFGYLLGVGAYDTIGQAILRFYGIESSLTELSALLQGSVFLITFTAAFTPFSDKIFNIVAGVFALDPFFFVLGLITGRGLRFFAVAYLAGFLGKRFGPRVYRYLNGFSFLVLIAVIILLFFFF